MNLEQLRTFVSKEGGVRPSVMKPEDFVDKLTNPSSNVRLECVGVRVWGIDVIFYLKVPGRSDVLDYIKCPGLRSDYELHPELDAILARFGITVIPGRALDKMLDFMITDIGTSQSPTVTKFG